MANADNNRQCGENVSTNCYYGYERITTNNNNVRENFVEIEFNNFIDRMDLDETTAENAVRKKRSLADFEYDPDAMRKKKQRLAEKSDTKCNKFLNSRQTHNIPDMPRCVMGFYI